MKYCLVVLLFCLSSFAEDSYRLVHDRDGTLRCIENTRSTGEKLYIPIASDNSDYQRFLVWNAAQTTPLVIGNIAPTPDTPAEVETKRKLALAITYLKAVPESWENGTNDQKLFWAVKQVLREIKNQLNE